MMNIGGRIGRWVVINILFSEHFFAIFRNILTVLGNIIQTVLCGVIHSKMTTLLLFEFELSPLINTISSFLDCISLILEIDK